LPLRQPTSRIIAIFCVSSFVAACDGPVREFAEGIPCEADEFIVEDQFDGSRRGACEVFADGHVRINIVPEDKGSINDSPWFAFRVKPQGTKQAVVHVRYHGGSHRYHPKWSSNGSDWYPVDEARVKRHWFGRGITINLDLQDQPLLIAAQEIILPQDMDAWSEPFVQSGHVTRAVLGLSGDGEPIYQLESNTDSGEVIFLASRQHPPEVTGAIGFFAFYEALLADNELANSFRDRFHIVAIPMLNPDGVKAGNWRHNLNGSDLNRDWGPFSQPETKLVGQLLDRLDSAQKRVLVSVDFHSTADNLIYRQEDGDLTNPAAFTQRWIAASLARLPGYAFLDEPRPSSDLPTSRNYMFQRYGIPAVTYEVGDNEDRDVIRQAATVFAEEFMRLFLETPGVTGQ